jgi:hypothetical protein
VTRRIGLVPLLIVLFAVGCGKKGPPLPPLVLLPAQPHDFAAARRGSTVAIQFLMPSANTDGSTPADLTRVDVYAMTGLSTLTAEEIMRRGTKVGSIPANPPRDPDVPDDEQPKDEDKPAGGIDQGGMASLVETVAIDSADTSDLRSYLAVGVNKRGRRGPISPRVLVPLVPAPTPPSQPMLTYDETSVTIAWSASEGEEPVAGFHVYGVGETETRLTQAPTKERQLTDSKITWDVERCYVVRAVAIVEGANIESDASPRACLTPKDTFPPVAPTGLQGVPGTRSIDLIWNPNDEADLAGYLVLRAIAPATTLEAITPEPLQDTTFRDTVPAGARVTYAVQAVDKAGNVGEMSARIEETAR